MIKFTKRTDANNSGAPSRELKVTNDRIKTMRYVVDGVGVSLIGKPSPLTGEVEIVVGGYSVEHQESAEDSYLYTQVNQHIKLKVPCENPMAPDAVVQALQSFCADKLRPSFSDDYSSFDVHGMCDQIMSDPDIKVMNCAAKSPDVQKKIHHAAAVKKLSVLTEEQRKAAFTQNNRAGGSRFADSPMAADGKGHELRGVTNEDRGFVFNDVADDSNFKVEFTEEAGEKTYTINSVDPSEQGDKKISPTSVEVKFTAPKNGGARYARVSNNRTRGRAFMSWRVDPAEDLKGQEEQIVEMVKESVLASITPSGFFIRTPFVRQTNDKFVSGFDGEMQARVPEANVDVPAKLSIHNQPASFIIEALAQLGYIKASESKESEVHRQNVYNLSSGHKVVTVNSDAARQNSWGTRSPLLWIVKNGDARSNSSGLIKKFIEMGAIPSHMLPAQDAVKKLTSEVMNLISNSETFEIGHAIDDGSGKVLRAYPPLPSKVAPTNDMPDFRNYIGGRGITPKVIDKVMGSGMIYPSENALGKKGYSILASTNFESKEAMIAQRFEKNRQGKVDKFFDKGAPSGGSDHVIKGSDQRYIVLGEATMDLYAFLSIVEQAGGDIEKYSIHSLMSATYVPIWMENAFDIRLPKDGEEGFGALINTVETVKPQEELEAAVESFLGTYDKLVFVDDGTPKSQLSKKVFAELTAMAGIPDSRIVYEESPSRQTKYKPSDELAVFDKTNLLQSLKAGGVVLDDAKKPQLVETRKEYVPITTDEHRAEAKRRIDAKSKGSEFVLAFDNDIAGHSKSHLMHNFLKSVGIVSRPFIVPFESRQGNEFSHDQVVAGTKSAPSAIDAPFNEFVLLNDINDYLNKLNAASPEEKARLVRDFKSQIMDTENADLRVNDALEVATLLHAQKKEFKQQYKYIFDLAKQIKDVQQNYGKVKRDPNLLKAYNAQTKQLRDKLEMMLTSEALPDSAKSYIALDKEVASVRMKSRNAAPANTMANAAVKEVKNLVNQMSKKNRAYWQIKDDPEKLREHNKETRQLREELLTAFDSLSDSDKTNIMRFDNVKKVVEQMQNLNKRVNAPKQQASYRPPSQKMS